MSDNQTFIRRHHAAWWIIGGIFAFALALGALVYRNYIEGMRHLNKDMKQMQLIAPRLSLEQCADHTMKWFQSCEGMMDICTRSVSSMMKICIVNGDKADQCSAYEEALKHPNFGYEACKPYLKNKPQKKACGDAWQAVSDFCLAAQTGITKTTVAPPL